MTISQELFELASAISDSLKRAREETFSRALKSLDEVSHEAARAWSGSNLGYHATTYYRGICPKPAGVQFSPEWGLIDSWPVHEPDPGWVVMDHQAVISELLSRAKIADISAIEQTMAELRDSFSVLKEQAISVLSAALSKHKDAYIVRQLKQIEELGVATPATITASLVPYGQAWSRDSMAVTQGRSAAPHQTLIAICLSETVTENGLQTLVQAVRSAATHLQRLDNMNRPDKSVRNNVVIGHGHSVAWRDMKDFVRDRLGLPYDEFNRISVAGIPNTIRLSQMLDMAAFAFIIVTAEDEQIDGTVRARENVVHEAGLFQGRLGFTKAIIILEEGCNEFSNIEGLGQIRFPKGNIGSAFEEIRRVLEREGLLEP